MWIISKDKYNKLIEKENETQHLFDKSSEKVSELKGVVDSLQKSTTSATESNLAKVSELKDALLTKQADMITVIQHEQSENRKTFETALEKQRLHYENLLQRMIVDNRNLLDRLMVATGQAQIHGTIPTYQAPETQRKEDYVAVRREYMPGVAAVMRAQAAEESYLKNQQTNMEARAQEVARQQKERQSNTSEAVDYAAEDGIEDLVE